MERSLDSVINIISLGVDWCNAVTKNLLFECHNNEKEYCIELAIIRSFMQNEKSNSVYVMGGINADISDKNPVFAKNLNHFSTDLSLILSSRELLPASSYTYISEAWHTTSWLDSCFTKADAHAALV